MRTSCFGCTNYKYNIIFHSPGREGRCSTHGWVKYWFPPCVIAESVPRPQPQQKQIPAAFYSGNKDAIKAKIKQAGLQYMPDFGRGDMGKWGYSGAKGELTFDRDDTGITVTASSAELLQVLEV